MNNFIIIILYNNIDILFIKNNGKIKVYFSGNYDFV